MERKPFEIFVTASPPKTCSLVDSRLFSPVVLDVSQLTSAVSCNERLNQELSIGCVWFAFVFLSAFRACVFALAVCRAVAGFVPFLRL